jgi:hypothetical protein
MHYFAAPSVCSAHSLPRPTVCSFIRCSCTSAEIFVNFLIVCISRFGIHLRGWSYQGSSFNRVNWSFILNNWYIQNIWHMLYCSDRIFRNMQPICSQSHCKTLNYWECRGLVVKASRWQSFDRHFEPYPRATKAAPLRCGLDAVPNIDGRIHQ